jgi:acetyltransferase-like isoleucine patch superfamily enzyme
MIHSLAHVEGATIGAGTRVWQFASVIRGARVGADCNIAANVIVDGARVGDRCLIGHGASVHPGSLVGDDVFIGPQVVLCNDSMPRVSKDGFDLARFDGTHWSTILEDGCSIGAGSVIVPGVRVGREAMIAANSVVTRDVPDCMLWRAGQLFALPQGERMRFAQAASIGL